MAASVFCKDFVNISCEKSCTHTKTLYVAADYHVLTAISFCFVEYIFANDGTLKLTTLERYRIYSVFPLPILSVTMENVRDWIN